MLCRLNELSTFNKEDPLVKRLFMLICAVEKGEGVYNG
jgi:hypothetical protein